METVLERQNPTFHHQYRLYGIVIGFLFFVGNNVDSIAVILIIWTMLLAGVLTFTYHQRKGD